MIRIFDATALAVSAAGVLAMVVAVLLGAPWREGVRMALSLWVAAGLLRLTGARDWAPIAASGAIIVARHIVSFGLSRRGKSRRGEPRPPVVGA